jgi:hypothetical protein
MAIGTKSSFKIYNEFTHSGYVETLQQVSEVFNQASVGTIQMVTRSRRGDFDYESFFKADNAGFISRRITTGTAATADVADTPLEQNETAGVKINRKIGPVANTIDSFKKIQRGPFNEDALNFAVGVQSAKGAQVEMCNTALRALRAALNAQAAMKHTVATNGTITTTDLVDGLAKMGDRASRVVCWVMHSKVFFNLVKEQIVRNVDGLSSFVVASASPVTLNRPVLVTDSPALSVVSGSPAVTDYLTLGLTEGAMTLEDSEEETIMTDVALGKENLIVRFQGEYAYNMRMRGYTWDVTNGGENPSDSAIGTGSNWDKVALDHKNGPGVIIQSR